ncbi:MAG: ATPase [Synergistaceae bacterium]|jgi:V/A-type H+-transporting ATPase subunit I|nr:ATPase [Synergistaceae bacterium]
MAVMKMIALTMVGPHEEMEPVARQMVLSGGFQPIPLDFLVNDRRIRSKITTEADNPYDDLLSRLSTVWKVADEPIPDPEPIPLARDFKYADAKAIVDDIMSRIESLNIRRNFLSEELEKLEAARSYVAALKNLNIKPSEFVAAKFVLPHFGRMTIENFNRLIESTHEAPLLTVELSRTRENVWVLIFTVPGYREGARKLFESIFFREFSIEEISDKLTDDDPLKQVEDSIDQHRKDIEALEVGARGILDENRKGYEELFSRLYTMQRVYDLCRGRGEVSGMYVLSGWIPEDTYESLKSTLAADAPMTTVITEQVGNMAYTGLRIPTMLRNNKLVRSFQDVVAMYSVPSYGEIDPSPFVAITFVLFFGFMFGDVGHGLLLLAAAAFLGKKKILSKPLAYVMKCASISSIVFGLMYGSAMGVENEKLALWLSPMHDTSTLFSVAILSGIVVISVGMILNIIVRYRERDFGRLLFDGQGLAGLFVYWGATVAIFLSVYDVETPFPVDYLWYVIFAVLLLSVFRDTLARTILRQSVHKEPFALQMFEVLHNLMNYFTNTASFVRLAAFALNHVALSFAVMTISRMFEDLPGGIILKSLMLIVGNLFIVGLEGMIVFIQVLRLEYYEFFGKFYRGGGNVFKPVTWQRDRIVQKS